MFSTCGYFVFYCLLHRTCVCYFTLHYAIFHDCDITTLFSCWTLNVQCLNAVVLWVNLLVTTVFRHWSFDVFHYFLFLLLCEFDYVEYWENPPFKGKLSGFITYANRFLLFYMFLMWCRLFCENDYKRIWK